MTIINADARFSPLKDESFHCCVTSVPYWGLRSYNLAPSAWGGVGGCEHEWGRFTRTGKSGGRGSFVQESVKTTGVLKGGFSPQEQAFCLKCGAWLGCLGLEPTPAEYIQHIVEVFREIKRVLRPDGVCFLNLGDSLSNLTTSSGVYILREDLEDKDYAFVSLEISRALLGLWETDGGETIKREMRELLSQRLQKGPSGNMEGISTGLLPETQRRVQRQDKTAAQKTPTGNDRKIGRAVCLLRRKGVSLFDSGSYQRRREAGIQEGYWPSIDLEESQEGGVSEGQVSDFMLELQRSTWPIRVLSSLELEKSEIPDSIQKYFRPKTILKPLDLCGIPGDVVRALRADGWWWRSEIVWWKPNPMPESVSGTRWERHQVKVKSLPTPKAVLHDFPPHGWGERNGNKLGQEIAGRSAMSEWADCPGCPKCLPNDGLILRKGSWRPTRSHEMIYMLTKSESYYADQEAVREAQVNVKACRSKAVDATDATGNTSDGDRRTNFEKYGRYAEVPGGRNLRDVWHFPTQPYKGAHFATFPEELARRGILAGTSEKGCCPKCGAPWARVIDKGALVGHDKGGNYKGREAEADAAGQNHFTTDFKPGMAYENTTLGWRPSCKCGAGEPVPCLVLDPFGGSGTVGLVAEKLGRRWVCLDLSRTYCLMAKERTREVQAPLRME